MKDRTISSREIPETISQLGKKEPEETRSPFSLRIKQSVIKKLKEKSREYGWSQQEIVDKALEAFLK